MLSDPWGGTGRDSNRPTHVVEAAQFVYQPVELKQVQVPVAQDGPFVDGGPWTEKGESDENDENG